MVRFVIKLAVVALIVHAAIRVGTTYWRFYQFEDALQELAQFGDQRPDKQLCSQAMDKAANLEVPIAADALTIRRGANPPFNCETGFQGAMTSAGGSGKIFIDGHYREDLVLLPGYRYPWDFTPSVNAWVRP
jgi:hypothetical protein